VKDDIRAASSSIQQSIESAMHCIHKYFISSLDDQPTNAGLSTSLQLMLLCMPFTS